jgi:hypothetical protein
MEAWWRFAHIQRRYRYSFSLYLPADFPIVPTRLVLAQWKQVCEWRRCRPQNPVLAIRYQNGELSVTRQDDDGKSILYSTKQEMRGRWLDFRFETRFSRSQDGLIGGWLKFGGYPRLPRAYGLSGGAGIRRVGLFISRLGCIAMRCGSR